MLFVRFLLTGWVNALLAAFIAIASVAFIAFLTMVAVSLYRVFYVPEAYMTGDPPIACVLYGLGAALSLFSGLLAADVLYERHTNATIPDDNSLKV